MKIGLLVLLIAATVLAAATCEDVPEPAPNPQDGESRATPAPSAETVATAPNLKVAFIGDSGNGDGFRAVLSLIKAEGADLVMHQGDFDYDDDPDGFFATIDEVLGPDFPYLASPGNHDHNSWPEGCGDPDGCYAQFLKERMSRIGLAPDHPDLNDQMYAAEYQGLKMVFVGQTRARNGDCGADPQGYACFIRNQLADDNHIWKVCSWHELQENMQVGGGGDEMGWAVYENCKNGGAIIATAHDHAYSRSKTLLSMRHPIVDPTLHPVVDGVPSRPNSVRVAPGASFVFVSGLGGESMRRQKRCLPDTYPYGCNFEWASVYSENQTEGVEKFGALFIEFNVDGNPYRARGYFKNTEGEIIDLFDITASPPATALAR